MHDRNGNFIAGHLIPTLADPDKLDAGTSASGIATDDAGNIYAADVAAHNLRKYVKVR